jgi:5-methylcytosine-specific restriction endonuclease McrA
MKHGRYVALYGNVRIRRARCNICGTYALVVKDGSFACCGKPYRQRKPMHSRRISQPPFNRRQLAPRLRRKILERQGFRCLYCGRQFGRAFPLGKKGLYKLLKIHFDHQIPFAYSANNDVHNFVAACHVCNLMKKDHIFQELEEARLFLAQKWQERHPFANGGTRCVH